MRNSTVVPISNSRLGKVAKRRAQSVPVQNKRDGFPMRRDRLFEAYRIARVRLFNDPEFDPSLRLNAASMLWLNISALSYTSLDSIDLASIAISETRQKLQIEQSRTRVYRHSRRLSKSRTRG